jgi:hypothetical protein
MKMKSNNINVPLHDKRFWIETSKRRGGWRRYTGDEKLRNNNNNNVVRYTEQDVKEAVSRLRDYMLLHKFSGGLIILEEVFGKELCEEVAKNE